MAKPAPWLVEHRDLLPRTGTALDLASGDGRNAVWLAAHGLTVTAIDRDPTMLAALADQAADRGLVISAVELDLERAPYDLGVDAFDVIAVFRYLHRPLFSALLTALRPAGTLVYETFTRAQAALGRPSNRDFLLEPGELTQRVASLEVLDAREGFFEGCHIASVVARKAR